jgi:DNA N-6-adenine-methyltransferase (Dam)
MVARQLLSSKSDRWFTPPDLLAEVDAFLGPGWYDPCPACVAGEPPVDGLQESWAGLRTYLNPPYGGRGARKIGPWIDKAMSEPVAEIVLLLPARTDTRWFRPLYDHTIVFIRGRLHFSNHKDSAPLPSALVYRGPRAATFAAAFGHRGAVLARYQEGRRR